MGVIASKLPEIPWGVVGRARTKNPETIESQTDQLRKTVSLKKWEKDTAKEP